MSTKRVKYQPKPCPFCQCDKSSIVEYDGDVWRVCDNCRAACGSQRTARMANEAWNVRVDKKTLKGGAT